MNNFLVIKIPYNLARFAVRQREKVTVNETNRIIKSLDTWLVLKSITRSGIIKNWNHQKSDLLTACKISETIFRQRLGELQSLALLVYDKSRIKLCSWETLGNVLGMDISQKNSIQYDIRNSQKVQQWIIATEILHNQNRQTSAIIKKLNENPDQLKSVQNAMIESGANYSKLDDIKYFLTWFNYLYRADFIRASEIHDLMIKVRPDINRGVITMADHWKAKRPITVSYWKKVLQDSGIAYITKMQIPSEERVRNSECKVLWMDTRNIRANFPANRKFQTLLVLCDNIQILRPWEGSNFNHYNHE